MVGGSNFANNYFALNKYLKFSEMFLLVPCMNQQDICKVQRQQTANLANFH